MIRDKLSYARLVEAGAAFLLLIYPSLMLAVKGGMNAVFLFLLLLSLGVLAYRPREMQPVVWGREMKFYLLAMASLTIAIFLSQSYHRHYSGHPYDAASRYLLAVPIFMLLQRMRFNVVATVQYGFPIAAIFGCLMIKEVGPEYGRFGIATMDLIHFGDFELVLGTLSILSINWTRSDALLVRGLKIIGFLAGIYASVVSGSRGGWIALPVFLMIFIYFRRKSLSIKTLLTVPVILVMVGFIAYTASHEIHHRVDDVFSDLTSLQHGDPDTSTGIRLQLYKAAADVFVGSPIFGVGPEGFANEMGSMLKAGKITPLAADLGKGEVHNELLSKAAGMGVFGLIAMLLIYLVPGRIFYKAMHSDAAKVRHSGMLGLTFVSGFMVFGLTVEVLNLTMATAFYSLTIAVLLAACLNCSEKFSENKKDHHV